MSEITDSFCPLGIALPSNILCVVWKGYAINRIVIRFFFYPKEKKKKKKKGSQGLGETKCLVRFTWCIAGTAQPAESVVGGTVSAL